MQEVPALILFQAIFCFISMLLITLKGRAFSLPFWLSKSYFVLTSGLSSGRLCSFPLERLGIIETVIWTVLTNCGYRQII